ncbi:uncharacterized protein A4U43_C06F17960 [Asparagus officinalis]|uniref:Uncharacterized protein n=1 Tax=Asparagus officinalis TaxID=4686 RepID=A0A5P1EQ18_ASPOF|nr:uncharacterized protein A4U43_C06F17960 [Asparagus officinalis]
MPSHQGDEWTGIYSPESAPSHIDGQLLEIKSAAFSIYPNLRVNLIDRYLVRDALVESEIYSQIEQVRILYLKLLGEVTSLRASRGVDSEGAAETPISGDSEVDRLKEELAESKRKARRLDEALQERDRALAHVEIEKQAVVHVRRQLDEEHVALVKLLGRLPTCRSL